MNELVVRLSQLELIAAGADVALIVPVAPSLAVLNEGGVTRRTSSM